MEKPGFSAARGDRGDWDLRIPVFLKNRDSLQQGAIAAIGISESRFF
ncbi:MAG: hypothetical protein F6J93_01440 [Oscillatoria sp. SIO1A7]|nr:hypothetical protein [Oscillatoria sp. SIO1A7]